MKDDKELKKLEDGDLTSQSENSGESKDDFPHHGKVIFFIVAFAVVIALLLVFVWLWFLSSITNDSRIIKIGLFSGLGVGAAALIAVMIIWKKYKL